MSECESIQVTDEMIAAGNKVLEDSGFLDNGEFIQTIPGSLLRDVFLSMAAAQCGSIFLGKVEDRC
jgi:hypothetical protein